MKTITLPIIVLALILFAIVFSYQLVISRRCKILKGDLLQSCKELFDTIGEFRDLTKRMKMAKDDVPSRYILQLDDLAEKERKIASCIKNTVQDAL